MAQQPIDNWLKSIITVVASLALLMSLGATILGKENQFGGVSLVFSSVAALVFGANLIKR